MGIKGRITRLVKGRGTSLTVKNTGPITAEDGGTAVSGYSGPVPHSGSVTVKNTGPATASGPGSRAVSGIDYT